MNVCETVNQSAMFEKELAGFYIHCNRMGRFGTIGFNLINNALVVAVQEEIPVSRLRSNHVTILHAFLHLRCRLFVGRHKPPNQERQCRSRKVEK